MASIGDALLHNTPEVRRNHICELTFTCLMHKFLHHWCKAKMECQPTQTIRENFSTLSTEQSLDLAQANYPRQSAHNKQLQSGSCGVSGEPDVYYRECHLSKRQRSNRIVDQSVYCPDLSQKHECGQGSDEEAWRFEDGDVDGDNSEFLNGSDCGSQYEASYFEDEHGKVADDFPQDAVYNVGCNLGEEENYGEKTVIKEEGLTKQSKRNDEEDAIPTVSKTIDYTFAKGFNSVIGNKS